MSKQTENIEEAAEQAKGEVVPFGQPSKEKSTNAKAGKGGKRNRHSKAKPKKPRNTIMCVKCGERFPAAALVVEGTSKRCPHCDERLTETAYDQAVKKAFELRDEKLAEASALNDRLVLVKEEAAALPSWRFIRRNTLGVQVQELQKQAEQAEADSREATVHVGAWAASRHLVGEWNRRSDVPLEVSNKEGKSLYRLKPRYTDEGLFFLQVVTDTESNKIGRSLSAEFAVYEALQRAATNPESPLHGAVVIPRAVISRIDYAGNLAQAEIDAVVATPSCAFLVEVKSCDQHVWIEPGYRDVYTNSSNDGLGDDIITGGNRETDSISKSDYKLRDSFRKQIESNRRAFASVTCEYTDHVHSVIVFTDPKSLRSPGDSFDGSFFIGWMRDGKDNVVNAMERKAKKEQALMTDAEFAKFAPRLAVMMG